MITISTYIELLVLLIPFGCENSEQFWRDVVGCPNRRKTYEAPIFIESNCRPKVGELQVSKAIEQNVLRLNVCRGK